MKFNFKFQLTFLGSCNIYICGEEMFGSAPMHAIDETFGETWHKKVTS